MDDNVIQSGQQQGGVGAVVVDKAKSAEQYIREAEHFYIVPTLIREKFPDLVKLIYETESMDKDEREYWLQIMPIMSEEQIVKFREILVKESEQLKQLDTQYKSEVAGLAAEKAKPLDEEAMKKKMADLKAKEEAYEAAEKAKEEAMLKELMENE